MNGDATSNVNMKLDAIVKALEAFQAKQEEHENCFRDIWSRLTTDNTGNENRNNDDTDPEPPLGTEGIEFFTKIPDPIESLQRFDGSRKQLTSWLNTAEDTLKIFKQRVSPSLY